MTSLGETYEKLMKCIRFFVNRAPGVNNMGTRHATGWVEKMFTLYLFA